MNFLDKSGHIFSLPSSNILPIGYEENINNYIFWLQNDNSNKLSIKNYYFRPVRIFFPDEPTRIEITIESNIFGIIGDKKFNSQLTSEENNFNITNLFSDKKGNLVLPQSIDSDDDDLNIIELTESNEENNYEVKENIGLTKKDELDEPYIEMVYDIKENKTIGYLVQFYIVGYSDTPDTWLSNILIKFTKEESFLNSNVNIDELHNNEEWCYITCGGEFVDESEPLIINGRNMGITLPKDILRAVYESNFFNEYPEEELFNTKMKELLLNYMNIRGQQGNYESAIYSLDWFGWGNKISISKLLKTDNEFLNQYILDYFDINNDIIDLYNNFKRSTFISLYVKENEFTNQYTEFNISPDDEDDNPWRFFGEGLPIYENLFDKTIEVTYSDLPDEDGNQYTLTYYKSYYDFTCIELSLKIAALKYYYEKYFLPIHLKVHNASIRHFCPMPDMKFGIYSYTDFHEGNYIYGNKCKVVFPNNKYLYLNSGNNQCDSNYLNYKNCGNYINLPMFNVKINVGIQRGAGENNFYNGEIFIYSKTENKTLFSEPFMIIDSLLKVNNFVNIYKEDVSYPITKKKDEKGEVYYTFKIKNDEYKIYKNVNEDKWEVIDKNGNQYDIDIDNYTIEGLGFNITIIKSFDFVFIPQEINKLLDEEYQVKNWLDNEFIFCVNLNGIWYRYDFIIQLQKMNIEFGRLEYKYDYHDLKFRQYDKTGSLNYWMYEENLATINNSNILTDIENENIDYSEIDNEYKANNINYSKLLDKDYKDFYKIFNVNNKYLNKIYWCDLNYETLSYNYDSLTELFFDDNNNWKCNIEYQINKDESVNIEDYGYDFYLMRNIKEKNKETGELIYGIYGVFISRETSNSPELKLENFVLPGELKFTNLESGTRFMINRYDIDYCKERNEFFDDDIIICNITNYQNIPFILKDGAKWEFEYHSPNTNAKNTVISKSNIGIMTLGDGIERLYKGYYNVKVTYTLDNIKNDSIKLIGKIFVKGHDE